MSRRRSYETLSTGEVATAFRVCHHTVAKWMSMGILVGHRIPGSRFRRFARADVEQFAREQCLTHYLKNLPGAE